MKEELRSPAIEPPDAAAADAAKAGLPRRSPEGAKAGQSACQAERPPIKPRRSQSQSVAVSRSDKIVIRATDTGLSSQCHSWESRISGKILRTVFPHDK
jgi:hypothetical protein